MKNDEVIWNEGVYYKKNRALLLRGDKIILRNTWTGKEREIGRLEEI